ncbi:MAG: hypothetical protein ACXVBZ_03260 [Flavisolibacter sp.]
MNRNFFVTALITAVVLFMLNAFVFVAFLNDFFFRHPAISESFMKQLYRPQDEIVVWAAIASALAIGLLVTLVLQWSGARTFSAGLKRGFVFGVLLLSSVDFGLLASTNNFTTSGALADLICSTTTITASSAFCAWMLGKGKKESVRGTVDKEEIMEIA